MMLSLVETIVVMYLLRQDEKRARKQSEDCTVTQSNSNYQNCYGGETMDQVHHLFSSSR